jgi:hypothetical protein
MDEMICQHHDVLLLSDCKHAMLGNAIWLHMYYGTQRTFLQYYCNVGYSFMPIVGNEEKTSHTLQSFAPCSISSVQARRID